VVRSFPSYGLTATEVRGAIREGASVVGDRIIVETDAVHAAQLGEVLGSFSNRLALTMELLVLDVASNKVDRVNAWLDSFNAAAGYTTKSAAASVVGPDGTLSGISDRGWTWDLQLSALFSMLDDGGDTRIELRQQLQVLSGTTAHFESGEVVETPLIVREPQTGKDLVSSIDRRTVGLTVDLVGTHFADRWLIDLTINDGSLQNGREVKTGGRFQRQLRAQDLRPSLLASFTRTTSDRTDKRVPVLGGIPKVGNALFRKSVTNRGSRSVMVLARPVFEAGP
jgi:type II secretory pathway component GspD/PulD (secretin)